MAMDFDDVHREQRPIGRKPTDGST